MAKLKSLPVVASAKRAFRKILGRDHDQSTTSATASIFDTNSKANTNTIDNSPPGESSRTNEDAKPTDTPDNQIADIPSTATLTRPVAAKVPPNAADSEEAVDLPLVDLHLADATAPTVAQEVTAPDTMPASVPVPSDIYESPVLGAIAGKENLPLDPAPEKQKHPNHAPKQATSDVGALASNIDRLGLEDSPIIKVLQDRPFVTPPVDSKEDELTAPELSPEVLKALQAEQDRHSYFTEEALEMARLALRTNETPVGCVFVHNDKIIARGMNATNVTRNGTRHAEFMALAALLSYPPKDGPRTTSLKPKMETYAGDMSDDNSSSYSGLPDEGNEDGRKGHLYPYGQKEHPDERVDRSILRECVLYVTVEPCVMCASLLRQLGIKKVYFGAVNDKFGGTGGVFSIHANSLPVSSEGPSMSAHPQPPPVRLPGRGQVLGTSFPPSGGDGGNVESGYEIEGGWGRDDAVGLLRKFYVQENGRAPVPRKKEGRAARLAALENNESENNDNNDVASVDSGPVGAGSQLDEHSEAVPKNGTKEPSQVEENQIAMDSKIGNPEN